MLIVGAKGFAKEVLEILHQNGDTDNLCFYDDVNSDAPDLLFGKFNVLKSTEAAKDYFQNTDSRFTLGIGNPQLRRRLAEKMQHLGGKFTSVVSNHAEVGSYGVRIENGCIIMGGVRISNDVSIGTGTMIYYNAVITHDVSVGEFVEISPSATVLGRAKIGSRCHLAAGSIIFPDVEVGADSVVAAGSVVRQSLPSAVMAAGVPAVIKKKL